MLLHCTQEDVHALVRAGLLKPLGNPPSNGRKLFHTRKLLEASEDSAWLAKITNAIYRRWKEKNGSRTGERRTKSPARELFNSEAA
jgi:hypothetical protein